MRSFDGFTRGINLGGWLSQYEKFDLDHFASFIVEEDIKRIASWGLDHVRVPVDYMVLEEEDGTRLEVGFDYIDKCIEWCKKYNLHMIIDLHKTYGYSFDPLDKTDKKIFFTDKDLQKRFFDLWQEIGRRYKDYSDFVCFELLNEIVHYEVWEDWNKVALECISKIREVAPNNWIIFGGVCYNSTMAVPLLANPNDDKVAYTFHFYEPIIFTHQGAHWVDKMPVDFRISYPGSLEEYRSISESLSRDLTAGIFNEEIKEIGPQMYETLLSSVFEACEKNNVPVYCGEYGVIDRADPKDMINWLRDINTAFNKYNVGRAYWSYKKMDFGISDDRCKDLIDDIVSLL